MRIAMGTLIALLFGVLATPLTAPVAAQGAGESDVRRSLPFAAGETHQFDVRFGVLRAGRAEMTVGDGPRIRGIPTMRFDLTLEGGIPLARVNNRITSWVQPRPFRSLRFVQDLDEVGTQRFRQFEIYPDSGFVSWEHSEGGREDLPSNTPLDDLSFFYYARTLPLEVGDRYELPHYFRDSGNPVVIEVLRKDEIRVPAGRYRTIVVRPTFQTSGLFGEGGEAEIHFSDDRSRILVKITSRVSRIGSLTLNLREDPRL
ncbi:MAG: DUF3108 domain-containing protein [Gemmatimonadales bacterium]|nr:MAG: DUF3108 domain-containing protein [Gemmatimonadales bacterium]